jgi:predicted signal transduction protein with EAL and GGDEF domain
MVRHSIAPRARCSASLNPGDAVLVRLAGLLQDMFRWEDIVCRYSGEEFVMLMEGASLEERLRLAATELLLDFQNRLLGRLTLSIGVTGYPDGGNDTAMLTRQANQALYRAKQGGRNQVVAGEIQSGAEPERPPLIQALLNVADRHLGVVPHQHRGRAVRDQRRHVHPAFRGELL